MKKEELLELGIDADVAKQVMALHGATVTTLNKQVATAESERDQFKEQIETNQTELNTLKEAAKGNEDLSNQLSELQGKFAESEKETTKKLAKQQKEFAIRSALKDANPLDEEIVLGQIDTETIKVVDGKLQGFEEQLTGLQESKSFLFQKKEEKLEPSPKITVASNAQGGQQTTGPMKQEMKSESFNLTNFLQGKGESK